MGHQVINLLHEQRGSYDAMEREVGEDFAACSASSKSASWNRWMAQMVMIACGGNLIQRK